MVAAWPADPCWLFVSLGESRRQAARLIWTVAAAWVKGAVLDLVVMAGLLWCVAGLLDMEEMWQPSREGGGAAKGLGYGARPSREKGEALEEICGSKKGDLAGGTRPWCGVCGSKGRRWLLVLRLQEVGFGRR